MSASFALEVKVPHRASISVQVSADDSVASLAAKAASALGSGTAVSDIRLCFRGHVLQDGAVTLSALGVTQAHFVVALPENGMVLSWQSASDGRVPVGAVRAGVEAINGAPLYLARAMIEGGAHPGKCAPHLDSCRAGYGGGEHVSKAYEVLVALDRSKRPWPQYQPLLGAAKSKPTFSALPVAYPSAVDGALPRGALSAGWEADGTRLFAALVADPHGGVCPGKTRPALTAATSASAGASSPFTHTPSYACLPASRRQATPASPPRNRHGSCGGTSRRWRSCSRGRRPPCPPTSSRRRRRRTPRRPRRSRRSRPAAPALHCHDMMGGYCEAADEGYLSCFGGWSAIDAFIYFSHQRVSLPPRCWIDACHARGMPCLGTLLTEGAIGVRENASLLARADEAAERLAELCASYGFDGWLINIEAPLEPAAVPSFVEFLQLLTICCKQRVGGHALVLYYDSLDAATGQVRYQNALTPANMPFFDACDGIFTNYWWRPGHLTSSAALAGPARMHDVYIGVDCFARGDLMYTAGAGCGIGAVRHAREAGLSLALFAPGWSLECGEAREHAARPDKARECDARFWEALGVERLYTAGANASSGASPSTK